MAYREYDMMKPDKGEVMMLRKNQKALQIETPEGWKYVFCYRGNGSGVVTTATRSKALGERDLEYFHNKFGNDVFRAEANLREYEQPLCKSERAL